jgi:ubiquinone/menaquinone biosynthesis C-methylase UbiE
MTDAGSREYFDRVAADWDDMREGFFSTVVRERAVTAIGAGAGMLVADVGAGTGFMTGALLEAGCRVIAVDESEAMLAELARKLAKGHRLSCRIGESRELPIASGTLDGVVANMYLHHVPDPAAAIGEIHRVLKPGGRAALTDLVSHSHELLRHEHHDRWLGFDEAAVARWFEQAGFVHVSVESADTTCNTTSGDGERISIEIFVAVGTA